jgi:V/A-type H+-transporting ATPase subunit D
MRRVAQNLTELHRLRRRLAAIERALPSLDLKRRQIGACLYEERRLLESSRSRQSALRASVASGLPMLADAGLPLERLVRVAALEVGQDRVAGIPVARLARVDFESEPYGRLTHPAWVDGLVRRLREGVEGRAAVAVRTQRVAVLEQALRRATQRVNLLEKLLIPRTRRAIRSIGIAIADTQRGAFVRAKIAKSHGGAWERATGEVDA